MTDVVMRPAIPEDAGVCARIMYAAFESLATRHAFPIEPQSPEFTAIQMESMLRTDGKYVLPESFATAETVRTIEARVASYL